MVPAIIALVKNDRRSTRLTLMSESKRVDGVCSVLEIGFLTSGALLSADFIALSVFFLAGIVKFDETYFATLRRYVE